jgi:murein DD-endopeptidase MepM/ murein hydrolase activator NlpD
MAIVLAATSTWSGAGAQSDDDAAQQAAREIQAARDTANQAAADFAQADFEIEALEEQAGALQQQNAQLQAEVDALRAQVEQIAVHRLMTSGSVGIPVLTGYQGPSDQLQADVLVDVATESSADAMDDFDEARKALEANQREVAANQAELEDQQARFEQLRQAAEAEVVHLQEVEAQRLEDERVRKILEAQRAEEQRQREEQERQQRAAAEAEYAAAVQRAADAAAAQQAEQALQAQQAQQQAAQQAASANDATPPPSSAASSGGGGSSGGGSSGGGGSATVQVEVPTPPPPPPPPRNGIICPVNGTAYSDTWGAARSGGRSHQGVDMLTHRGNPIYAVVSGSVQFKENRLGGNSAWVSGNNGDRYYYAHMDHYEGASRSVSQGEVIGYVGDTGNARGTPHLHFEVHPGGGAAVNPYPYVRDAGC